MTPPTPTQSINTQDVMSQLFLLITESRWQFHWQEYLDNDRLLYTSKNIMQQNMLLIPALTPNTIILWPIIVHYVVLYVINDDNVTSLDRARINKKEYLPEPQEFNKDR